MSHLSVLGRAPVPRWDGFSGCKVKFVLLLALMLSENEHNPLGPLQNIGPSIIKY